MYDLIIVGGGPAGISAGIYAARKKLKTLLLTKDFLGQAGEAFVIENYPGFKKISGMMLAKKFEDHLRKFEIEIKKDQVVKIEKKGGIFIVLTKNRKRYRSSAVIVASGRDPRPLEVPGEKKFIGRGVSYCPICDAPFYKNKVVVVIGGGNAGFRAAIELTKYARKVYLFEVSKKPRADEIEQERAKRIKKIEVMTSTLLKRIKGDKKVKEVEYLNLETGKKETLRVDGIFVQIGSQPATSFVKDLVNFNKRDEIKINPKTCQTKTEGLFAAGDITDTLYKQIIIAAGEGAKAALSAHNYLLKIQK
jgi:thioredoxin-disulfide reductase